MYKNLIKISTVGMEREEWLSYRRKSIGGSDAAAILGLNPFSSPYSVWADKLGYLPDKEDTEALRIGRDLEDYVAKRFTEATGKKVRRENNILINPDYPFAHANVDRMIIGEDAGLECKTTSSLNLKKFKNGEFPETYYVQCVHYMMVTGAKKWYLAVLVLGREFMWFEIERDEEEIAALAKGEEEFFKLVETKTAPVADGKQSTTEAIAAVYPDDTAEAVSLIGYEAELQSYNAICARIKELERDKDECANKIKAFLGECEGGESDGFRVSWRNTVKQSFDYKKFIEDHEGIDLSGYFKQSSYRAFKVIKKQN